MIVKYDVQAGRSDVVDLGPHAHPGEFVFVRESDDQR